MYALPVVSCDGLVPILHTGLFPFPIPRYLKSTSGNIQLINSFRNLEYEKLEEKLFGFWMEFFMDASKEEFTNTRFPVSHVTSLRHMTTL